MKETRAPLAATREHPQRVDYEYERAGTAAVFLFCEPLGGWREATARERRTKTDWALEVAALATTGDLVHNVLCLANAGHEGPRFVVFGVEDSGVSVRTVKDDDRRRTQADIAGLFHDNAGKFFQSRFPTCHLPKIETDTNSTGRAGRRGRGEAAVLPCREV